VAGAVVEPAISVARRCPRLHPVAVHHPTVLSTFAWKWMFDPTFSVINWMLFKLSLTSARINWLGDPDLAIISVIIVNVWRGVPFYAISLLAGLQTISPNCMKLRRSTAPAPGRGSAT